VRADELGARDGWVCWLCEAPVDPAAPAGSPFVGTVDHVVPRSRGGSSSPANLRLAHRRCNGARGRHLPELAWPASLGVVDAAPLWTALARLVRRPGSSELVAVVATPALGEEAAGWARRRAERFLGGTWRVRVAPVGAGDGLVGVWLSLDPDSGAAPTAGRPVPPGRPSRRRTRRR
jgi:hypothetical protein